MRASPDQSSAAGEAPPAPRVRKWGGALGLILWIAGGAAALVGLYAAFGFWAAPKIIREQVTTQIAERYHRKATLGEVKLNPFTFKLDADRFSLPDADGKPMLGFGHLTIDLAPASLWRRGLVFDEIGFDAPDMRLVRRADGRLNIQDLMPASQEPAPEIKVAIDHLIVRGGRAEVTDLARRAPFTKIFSPIAFTLNDFSTTKNGAAYVLNAVSERGEGLAWRGVLGLSPLASKGTFAVTKVQVRPMWELVGDAVSFLPTSGDLNLSGGYDFALRGETLALKVDVGDLRLAGVGLRAQDAPADWVTLPAVQASGIHIDVPAQTLSVARVEATDPSVTAWTERNGEINLLRYALPPKGAPPQADAKTAAAAPAPAWKIDLPDLRVRGAKIAFEERTAKTPVKVTVAPLDVAVAGFAFPIAKPVKIEASTGLDGGGRLAAKGTVALDKISGDLDVEAANLDLPRLQPYIDNAANLKLLSGRLSGKGRMGFSADGQDFVNWRSLRFEGVSARSQPVSLKVREVVAQEPYAKVVVGPNYVMNIATVLNPNGVVAEPAAPPPPKPVKAKFSLFKKAKRAPPPPVAGPPPRDALPVEIGLVRVQNGRMDFADITLQPNFAAGIESLEGTIKGLSGRQDARADVALTGQVDRYAPVKIEGQVNYFAAKSFTDVTMAFQNMELTTFSPYSGKFAGYRVNKGKLDVDLHYNIDDQKLDANHRVVINQLELGEKVESADAVKLPVKLIVALLKDRHGVIDIPIEINGTLDDPNFRVWPLIWKVVGNLMVKIVTSPFALLGSLGGGGGEEMQYVDFAPGVAVLNEADRERITALAKALAERPALNLEIPMPVSPALDKPALIDARFKTELDAAATERLGKRANEAGAAEAALNAPKTRRAILEGLYRKTFGAKPEIPKPEAEKEGEKADADKAAVAWLEEKIRGRITISDDELHQLGRARADAVQGMLLEEGGVEASRVFVVAQPQDAPAGASPVRMKLSLS